MYGDMIMSYIVTTTQNIVCIWEREQVQNTMNIHKCDTTYIKKKHKPTNRSKN